METNSKASSDAAAHFEHLGMHLGSFHYRTAAIEHLYSANNQSEDFSLKPPGGFTAVCLCFVALVIGTVYLLNAPVNARSPAVIVTDRSGTGTSGVVEVQSSRALALHGKQIVILSEGDRVVAIVNRVEKAQANASGLIRLDRHGAGAVVLHVSYINSPPRVTPLTATVIYPIRLIDSFKW